MPVMFFVAGTLLPGPAPWRRCGPPWSSGPGASSVPLWLYAATVGVVLLVAGYRISAGDLKGLAWWVLPLGDPAPSRFHAGWLSNHLWYLRAYLWILVLAPLLHLLARRLVMTVAAAAGRHRAPRLDAGVVLARARAVVGPGARDRRRHRRLRALRHPRHRLRAAPRSTRARHRRADAHRARPPRGGLALLAACSAGGTVLYARWHGLPTGGSTPRTRPSCCVRPGVAPRCRRDRGQAASCRGPAPCGRGVPCRLVPALTVYPGTPPPSSLRGHRSPVTVRWPGPRSSS